ncbi:MAG: hypothetical protein GXP06_02500 [Alphaproteobacteria bacterium]|nr:hypothetical protein [Alphaproteobacteria bacterium]
MKKTALAFAAALVATTSLAATSASAFEYSTLAAAVDTTAFENADDAWRRMHAKRISECRSFGKDRIRRVDVLVDRYRALADAVTAGDESAAINAAGSLSRAIKANPRFETCWKRISRKQGISSKFTRMIKNG